MNNQQIQNMMTELNNAQDALDTLKSYLEHDPRGNDEGKDYILGQISLQQMFVDGIAAAIQAAGIRIKNTTTWRADKTIVKQ